MNNKDLKVGTIWNLNLSGCLYRKKMNSTSSWKGCRQWKNNNNNRAIRVMKDGRKLCFCGCHCNLNGKCKTRIVCNTTKKTLKIKSRFAAFQHCLPPSCLHSPSVPHLTEKKKKTAATHQEMSRGAQVQARPLWLCDSCFSPAYTHQHADILACSVASHARKA